MRLTVPNQKLPAGLEDSGVEFYVLHNEVRCLHGGRVYRFDEIPQSILDQVEEYMMSKPDAVKALLDWDIKNGDDMLRQFIACRFGGFDTTPDIAPNSSIIEADYFDCGRRGRCKFEGKLCSTVKVANGYLTKQEIRVLQLIAQGKLNKEIAAELHISEETVSSHNQNIQVKTGCYRKPELAILAREKNLI